MALNSNYQKTATSAIFLLETRNNNFKIAESRYFDQANFVTALSPYRSKYLYVALNQDDTLNGGDEENALLIQLDTSDLEETDEEQWLLNAVKEVVEIVAEIDDTTVFMLCIQEDETKVTALVRQSDDTTFHSTYEGTSKSYELTLTSLSAALDSNDDIQHLLVLGYHE